MMMSSVLLVAARCAVLTWVYRQVVRRLVEMGVESIAVCLINSFENPTHELLIKEILQEEAPDLSVSISY